MITTGVLTHLPPQTGDQLENVQAHEFDHQINDLQFSPDRTYFITASKDKSAKVCVLRNWSISIFPF